MKILVGFLMNPFSGNFAPKAHASRSMVTFHPADRANAAASALRSRISGSVVQGGRVFGCATLL